MDYRLGRLKGQFVVVWEEGGRRRRYRLGALSPAEARAAIREFAARRIHALDRAPGRVEAIWHAYITDRAAEKKIALPRMREVWHNLAPHFGSLFAADISPSVVRDYTARRRGSGVGDGTIHTELTYLRAALRKVLKGRAPEITLPPKPRPRTRHLTPDEAGRLIDAAAMPHVRLYVLLAIYTAGRPSSILDLEWDRVDFAARKITFDNPSRDRTAKGRATVPMAAELVVPLEDARKAALTPWVIEWAGKPVRSVRKGVQQAARRASIKGVTPYVLRHTAAVFMAEGGVPMSELSQFLGHTSTSVTERVYARFSPEHLRRASNAISAALSGSTNRKP